MVKNPPANAGDVSLIPGSGRSPGEEMATHSSILAWRIPGTEEPGRLQSMGTQSRTCLKRQSSHACINKSLRDWKDLKERGHNKGELCERGANKLLIEPHFPCETGGGKTTVQSSLKIKIQG